MDRVWSPEKTGQKGELSWKNAFAGMKTIILRARAARSSSRCLSASTDASCFQVPRGKAVEVPEPVEVLENARRQLEAARKIEDELAAG